MLKSYKKLKLSHSIGNPECIKKVVEKGGDLNFRDNRKKTALEYAEMGATEKPDAFAKVLGLDYKGVVETIKEIENSTGNYLT